MVVTFSRKSGTQMDKILRYMFDNHETDTDFDSLLPITGSDRRRTGYLIWLLRRRGFVEGSGFVEEGSFRITPNGSSYAEQIGRIPLESVRVRKPRTYRITDGKVIVNGANQIVPDLDLPIALDGLNLDEVLTAEQVAKKLQIEPYSGKSLFYKHKELLVDGTNQTTVGKLLRYVLTSRKGRYSYPERQLEIARELGATGSLDELYAILGIDGNTNGRKPIRKREGNLLETPELPVLASEEMPQNGTPQHNGLGVLEGFPQVDLKTTVEGIQIVSAGKIKVDGGSLFGDVPRPLWQNLMKPDKTNKVKLGLNCLLIQTNNGNILVDTGVGPSIWHDEEGHYSTDNSTLLGNLQHAEIAVWRGDIKYIILTHLHFDHAGGSVRLYRVDPSLTFPNAKYLVQSSSLGEARRSSSWQYNKREIEFLEESGRLEVLDGDEEIVPGIRLKVTGGHTRGHQIVLVESGAERVAFLGDLAPTQYHLFNTGAVTSYDIFPEETRHERQELLKQLEGSLVVLYHDPLNPIGYIERANNHLSYRPVKSLAIKL